MTVTALLRVPGLGCSLLVVHCEKRSIELYILLAKMGFGVGESTTGEQAAMEGKYRSGKVGAKGARLPGAIITFGRGFWYSCAVKSN